MKEFHIELLITNINMLLTYVNKSLSNSIKEELTKYLIKKTKDFIKIINSFNNNLDNYKHYISPIETLKNQAIAYQKQYENPDILNKYLKYKNKYLMLKNKIN
jgi:hypothetical protein